MKNGIILEGLSVSQITSLFEDLKNQISDLRQNLQPKVPNEYITRNELAEMLKVDRSTIHNWCKKGKILPRCLGNRVYFLRSEIEAALIPISKRE